MPDDLVHDISTNQPPLAEMLAEETKPLRERADALITSVNNSKIDSPESAAQVTQLGNMLAEHRAVAEAKRKEAAKPFDDGKATVQATYARGIIAPLDAAIAACRRMLDAWRDHLTALAAAEQRKRDGEAAEARRLAEEAESKKIELQNAGDTSGALAAELRQLQAEEHAEHLTSGEGAIRPAEIIRTQAGQAGTATQRVPTVTNIGLCLRWLIENHSAALLETLAPLIARLTRAKIVIPGVEVKEVSGTRFRR